MNLIALQTKTKKSFRKNLKTLIKQIKDCKKDSFILAPELCLTGFIYDKMDEASEFTKEAIESIKALSKEKTIAITFIEKKDKNFYNTLYIFHKNEVIHTQSKHRLFPLGDEPAHFEKGDLEDMKIIDIDGVKVATLICFEIRFPQYWLKVLGADLIINPSMWGIKRKSHFETMTKALAVANQCFVLTSNSANKNMAKGSGIISPWGDEIRDDEKSIIEAKIDLEEIRKIRKYIDIGINKNEEEKKMKSILFVCLGNICRSPLAEGIARKFSQKSGMQIKVDSAGTGSWHVGEAPCANSIKVAKENDIDISKQRARQVSSEDFKKYDYIIGLDESNISNLKKLGCKEPLKLGDFGFKGEDVPDPYFFNGFDGFDKVFNMIEVCVKTFINEKLK